ncbi:MAG: hypothetical protein ACREOZ_05235, partial [Gloeomargaritales cyanobacterium]
IYNNHQSGEEAETTGVHLVFSPPSPRSSSTSSTDPTILSTSPARALRDITTLLTWLPPNGEVDETKNYLPRRSCGGLKGKCLYGQN